MVLLQGSVSDPVNLDENRLVMLKLKEHLPVALKPVEEVRDEIIATLSDNLARDSANARAVELLAALQSGDSELEELVAESGLVYARHEEVKRNAFVPDAMLVQEIFRLASPLEGSPVEAVLPTTQGFAVVQLESVVRGQLDSGTLMVQQQYERVIANGNASQENAALMRQLRTAAKIEVYEDRIQ